VNHPPSHGKNKVPSGHSRCASNGRFPDIVAVRQLLQRSTLRVEWQSLSSARVQGRSAHVPPNTASSKRPVLVRMSAP
jgi:hypothetical protein